METILSVVKSVIDAFSKKISLYPFLISVSVVSFVIAYFESNHIALYVGIGLFLFCICDFVTKRFEKWQKALTEKRFHRLINSSDGQRRLLKSLSLDAIELLDDLYGSYPDGMSVTLPNSAFYELNACHALHFANNLGFVMGDGHVVRMCSLQPWMKQCIDKNHALFQCRLNGEDVNFDNKEEQSNGNQ